MDQGEFALSDREFKRIKQRVYEVAGISLSEAKRTLVVSRLSKLVRALNFASFDSYIDHLENGAQASDDQDFVNALTTNLTRFYREDHHFTHLRAHIAGLMEHKPRVGPDGRPRLRIWSAGCSTGQEPYTIAMDLLWAFPDLRRWDFRILATDIDTQVLTKASLGVYPDTELSGLSLERAKLFERAPDGKLRIPMAARSLIAFKALNLMVEWPMKGPFDVIFCRNVAIYFDRPTQAELFRRLGEALAPGGVLYIGHSENLGAGAEGMRLVGKTTYQSRTTGQQKQVAA